MTHTYEKVLEKIVDNKKALFEQYKKEMIKKMNQRIEAFVSSSNKTYFDESVYVVGVISNAEIAQLKKELSSQYVGFLVKVTQELQTSGFYGDSGTDNIVFRLEAQEKKV